MQQNGGKLGNFEITGPAQPSKARGAGLLDLLLATIVAMLIFPQPVVRAVITGAGIPIGAFVASLLIAILLVFWLYLAFCAVMWGRTPSMYLFDLGLDTPTKPTLGEAVRWSTGWVFAALPALVGARAAYDPESGWPSRFSGSHTRSTAPVRED